MELGILHNSPPSTKRGCRAGRLHRLWHGLPPAPWPCSQSQHHSVPSRNLHPLMVPPFLQPHPDLQSAVGNAPLSSKHPAQLPTTDCLLSIISPMGGQPSDAPALSPPSPLQQGGQSSNAPALSPPSPLPQGGQPIALALSPPSPPPQGGQPSDAPGLSPSSSTLLLCPSDSTLNICHLNSQSAVKTDFTNASPDNPQLILLDGHHSHKTLEAVEFCRDKGIELISFPPYCTHKLQPLDRTYFKALKASFNAEADNWMVSNPGQRITVHNMAALAGKAFLRTALPEKAVNGFKTCGLEPFDPNVFTDADFEGVLEMDEPRDVDLLTTTDGMPAGNGGAPYVREATLQDATEVHQAQNEPTLFCIPPPVDSSDQPTCSTTMEQPASHIPS
ncbi:hypothetical protein ACOMHN_031154 [Nucella lapillus]